MLGWPCDRYIETRAEHRTFRRGLALVDRLEDRGLLRAQLLRRDGVARWLYGSGDGTG
jgi:hypothetical protein